MATDALSAARPSRSDRFRDTILLFVAIRDRDLDTVTRLLRADPALVNATEDWSTDEALAAGLQFAFAGRASALIRAAETGDVELVRCFVEGGAPVRDVCNCAGAESPLWAAAVRGDRDVVEYLLDAGADPNTPAFAGATPLHVAMQRGHHDLVPRLLEAGADPDRVDDHGRTPADWLALHRPAPLATSQPSRFRADRDPRRRSLRAVAPGKRAALAARGRTRSDGPAVRDRGGASAGRVLAPRVRARSLQPGGRRAGDARDGSRVHRAARARRRRRAGRGARTSGARSRSASGHLLRSWLHCSRVRGTRTTCCSRARSWRAIRTCSPRSSSSPSTGPIRTSRRNHPKASTRRSPSTGTGRSVRCGPPSTRRAPGAVGTRASGTSSSPTRCAIASPRSRSKAMRRCRGSPRYFAQPFTLAEPFTSRPGERTAYDTMLDEVEALVSGA